MLQAVSERLARLLAETPPRREAESGDDGSAVPPSTGPAGFGLSLAPPAAGPGGAAPSGADAGAAVPPVGATELGGSVEVLDVEEVAPPRRFGRLHVGVVCLLLLLGLAWAGWSMLRARPVALATPVSVTSPSPAGPSPATGPSPTTGAGPMAAASPGASASPSGGAAALVVVHILGAVRRPGVVSLPGPARVQDAVDAAGGLTAEADPDELNLAQLLTDGQQVVIGTRTRPEGEVRGAEAGAGAGGTAEPGSAPSSAGAGGTTGGGVVDLNTATAAQLEELPGVGPVTAAAIVAWRQEHGRFSRAEELQEVDGIGPKTYAQIVPHVRV